MDLKRKEPYRESFVVAFSHGSRQDKYGDW
jgi:hypothetical protein